VNDRHAAENAPQSTSPHSSDIGTETSSKEQDRAPGARHRPEHKREARSRETNPWLLSTRHGVIDLRTGSLRGGRPNGSLCTAVPARWKGLEESAPRFEQFLQEIFADRKERERAELIAFLQRALGYGITGKVNEQIFLALYGEEGSNGKRTLMRALSYALGRAVGTLPPDVLTRDTHLCLRTLQGKRIVWVSEPDDGTRFATDQLTLLTDGEAVTARRFYTREVTFTPSHLLILLSARKPEADPSDRVFWERICPIAFNMRFVARPEQPNEQLRDAQLARHLRAEASGILAWLVRGALEWHHLGLAIPCCVLQMRKACSARERTVAGFLHERCTLDANAHTPADILYKSYRTWAADNGLAPLGNQQFAREVRQIDGVQWQRSKQGKFYQGIALQDR
jgi:putative DNA primase/helicase